ncbi:GSCFA domain-containing protein [Mariniflexile ostreae]|uniref:GSCFA domain-containing protein n=1 Tax=Mariniflexile ostreae TaxID=1520892 RepID=A0ABV5F9Q2_9FLAO
MKLQTQIALKKQEPNALIDYNSKIVLIGSCFSDNIGKKLAYFKFYNLQNPLGILFHPKAIETLISKAINKKKYSEKDVFFHTEQWHCFEAHSKLSHSSKNRLLNKLNEQLDATYKGLEKASHIIITLGTAWVYRFVKSDEIVSNCHKVSQKEFKKELLRVEAICQSLHAMVDLIGRINPNASVVFTVSPIRHLKDGFIENMQSKAHLITAIHQFLNQQSCITSCNAFYFPSYEIMMDELRDYRFYKEDMIHPNETAIQYVWEKFQQVWMSESALKTMEEVDGVQKSILHKPFNANSEAHRGFLQKLEYRKIKLQKQHSCIVFHAK